MLSSSGGFFASPGGAVAPAQSQACTQVVSLDSAKQPVIYIIGTGGTIAGTAASSTASTYQAGKVSVEYLLASVPDLKKVDKKIKGLNLFQIDSSDITDAHWLALAKEINRLLNKPRVKGVVITHGTDTLEETAYFLDLVIKNDKPVVLVGAMRASTSTSADGPLNLFNAASVASAPESRGRGVMVVINDTIYDARDITKTHTTKVDTFVARNSGPLGSVSYGEVRFTKSVIRKHTLETPFDVSELTTLPCVEIVYEHAGQRGRVLKAVIASQPDGIVIAGTGNGNIPAADKAQLEHARRQNIAIVRSSRTGSGYVTEDGVDQLDTAIGLIAGDDLNPQKARILLMLSLIGTTQPREIKQHFKAF